MNISTEIYILKTKEEIRNKVFGVTKSLLEVHSFAEKDGEIQIERIDFETYPDTVIVYIAVVKGHFFVGFYFNTGENPELRSVEIENGSKAYFTITSETLNFTELSAMTNLKPLIGWSKGDSRPNGKSTYNFTRLMFDPFPSKAYDLGFKVKKLVEELEKDSKGVKSLLKIADYGGINCAYWMHSNANKGIHLDEETMIKMGALGLYIDFDQYITGTEFINNYPFMDGSDLIPLY